MILLCPLIHPPNRCRSQWLYTNAFFPSILWINTRLVSSGNERRSKGEMRVCERLCLSLGVLCLRACVCQRERVGPGQFGECVCLCLFQAVVSYSLPPLVVMACLWDSDIKLSDWSLSAFEVSWAVRSDLSSRGGISPVWLLSEDLSSLVFANTSNKAHSSHCARHQGPPGLNYFKHISPLALSLSLTHFF